MMSEQGARVQLEAATRTDVGVVREHNEDSAHVDPQNYFFIVADGMGGHAAGEVASAMAVDKVREALEQARSEVEVFSNAPDEDRRKALVKTLESAVRNAHQSVYDRGTREPDKQGMGTTLDVVLVAGHEAFVAHVGDSRTYLVREGKAAQITTDHTVAEVLVIEGKLSLEEAQISPLRTILVNAIGVAPDVGIEMAHVQLRAGDHLLLCSDGLHDYFPVDQELADHITANSPDEALRILVDMAKDRGGHDNITGIVVDVVTCEIRPDSNLTSEITQKLPVQHGIPGAIERDDTLPVERVTMDLSMDDTLESDVSDSEPDKKKRKKRKRSQKNKRQKSTKKTTKKTTKSTDAAGDSATDDSATDDSAREKSPAKKASDDKVTGDKNPDDVATRTTEPLDAVVPADADNAEK